MTIRINLRASSAYRWMNCPGSAKAAIGLPDKSNIYAERGTVAHALLEMALVMDLGEEDLWWYDGKHMPDATVPQIKIDEEMIRGVGHALDYIRSYCTLNSSATFFSETEVDLRDHTGYWITGTSDAIIENFPEELVVVDYKHGVVGVDEEDNPQLLTYGLGHWVKRGLPKVKSFRLVIIQPRARDDRPPVRETVIPLKDMRAFERRVVDAAKAAHQKDAPRKAGSYCRFCRVAGTCRENATATLAQARMDFKDLEDPEPRMPTDMTPQDIATVLSAADRVRAWLTAVEGAAIEQMLNRDTLIPGYKVVGSQTRRKWSDEQRVLALIPKTDLDRYAPRSPITPTQLEKVASAKRTPNPVAARLWERARAMVVRNPQEPRVVPQTDPRPPFVPGQEFEGQD